MAGFLKSDNDFAKYFTKFILKCKYTSHHGKLLIFTRVYNAYLLGRLYIKFKPIAKKVWSTQGIRVANYQTEKQT